MGNLPLAVNEVAAVGTQAKSATDNDLQKGQVQKSHGSVSKFFPINNPGATAAWDDFGVKGLDTTVKPQCDIVLEEGTIITAMKACVLVANSQSISIQLIEWTKSTGGSSIDGDSPVSGTVDGFEAVPFTTALPYTVPANTRVVLFFNTQHANHECYGADVDYYRPIV